MIRKLFFPFALGAIVLVLAGCGKKEQIDPYTKASLREATYGEVTSDGFMYKIVNPTVIDTLGNFVVARQGNLTMFITGNNIARQAGKLGDPSKLTFNVVKRFKPMVHFQCTSIVSPTDSIVVENGESVTLPNTTDIGSFAPPAEYTRMGMDDLKCGDAAGLRDSIGKKLSLRARIVRVDSDSTSFWMLEGDKSCPSPFFRHGESAAPARLRFTKLDPTLEIVMRMLVKTDQLFDGGVTLVGAETLSGRAGNQTCGTVEIGYVRYLDTVFTR